MHLNVLPKMNRSVPLIKLRQERWQPVPTDSGVYWWFFPQSLVSDCGLSDYCDLAELNLRGNELGQFCLYHGLARNLSQRISWHADQELTQGALRTGFLSTFRFTLLSLFQIEYYDGKNSIDSIFDQLSVSWQVTSSKEEAKTIEEQELRGNSHYPLNIQGNRHPETLDFIRHLKAMRKCYKAANLVG